MLDLDYRPMFWTDPASARELLTAALARVTVAVGNLEECRVAVGEHEPSAAAKALREAGADFAIVKQGPAGVLGARGSESNHNGSCAEGSASPVVVLPYQVEVVNGLGAGDAFGGALCHGLLSGWDTAQILGFANAAGAIVASRLACADAMPTVAEVRELML